MELRITSYNVCYTKLLRGIDENASLPAGDIDGVALASTGQQTDLQNVTPSSPSGAVYIPEFPRPFKGKRGQFGPASRTLSGSAASAKGSSIWNFV